MLLYNISILFLEIRLLFFISLYIFIFIQIGVFNSLLINFLQDHFKFLLILPVLINNINIDLWNGIFIIYDFKILVPPLNEDNRWKKECIVHIDSIVLEFSFIQLIIGYILSNCNLIYITNIYVNSLTLTVEGYDDAVTGGLLLNIGLIGGPTIEDEEVIVDVYDDSTNLTINKITCMLSIYLCIFLSIYILSNHMYLIKSLQSNLI